MKQIRVPSEGEYVIVHSTLPGYVSLRNPEYGSWFIKAFTDTMFELARKEHLMDILIEVNRRVAEEFQSRGRNKQIMEVVSMLTRKLYFRPGTYDSGPGPPNFKLGAYRMGARPRGIGESYTVEKPHSVTLVCVCVSVCVNVCICERRKLISEQRRAEQCSVCEGWFARRGGLTVHTRRTHPTVS